MGRILALSLCLCAVSLQAQVSISTGQYNNQRTGANTSETILNQSTVTGLKLLGTYAVDGNVLAQPLVISGVNVSGATKLLITVTMNNSIYAFDADRPGSAFLWKVNVGTPVTHPDLDLYNGVVGCVSTPVVDVPNSILYVVCDTSASNWTIFSFNLDGTTHHTGVTITATTFGSNTFDPAQHLQRPALLFANNKIYVGFGSYGDALPYQGWLMAYSSTLTRTNVWCSVSTGGQGGVWMGGGGPAADSAGNVYVITGNGDWNGAGNYSESFVKLSSALAVLDYMTPSDWDGMNSSDADLGSLRPILTGSYVMSGGKDGRWWVLNQSGMGTLQGGGGAPIQQVWTYIGQTTAGRNQGVWGNAAFANNALYLGVAAEDPGVTNNAIYRFSFSGSTFNTTPVKTAATFPYPGAAIAYSSNGSTAGTGLLWAAIPKVHADTSAQVGKLLAYNADTLVKLYDSDTNGGDALGDVAKFAEPTVANGVVFVATNSNKIAAYGLLNLVKRPNPPTNLTTTLK